MIVFENITHSLCHCPNSFVRPSENKQEAQLSLEKTNRIAYVRPITERKRFVSGETVSCTLC